MMSRYRRSRQLTEHEERLQGPRRSDEVVRPAKTPPRGLLPFAAWITGNESIGTNRWKYGWEEVTLDGDDLEEKSGGRSGTTIEDYALNIVEDDNDANDVGPGVDVGASGYQSTSFEPQPIRTGTGVIMHQLIDTEGERRYVFALANAHDGDC
jgi:hypothetical protein